MNSNGNIYIDIDDVISDSSKVFPELVSRHFNKECTVEEITSFDLMKSLNLTKGEYAEFMDHIHSSDILRNNSAVERARESIHALKESGYTIIVVTGRPVSAYEDSLYWLQSKDIPFEALYFVDKYSRYPSNIDHPYVKKFPEMAEFDFQYAIEDSFDTGVKLAGMGISVALLDRPWNRLEISPDAPGSERIRRCFGWDDVTELILNEQIKN